MTSELSEENRALVERVLGGTTVSATRIAMRPDEVNRLLDAARAQGERQPPDAGTETQVYGASSTGEVSRAPQTQDPDGLAGAPSAVLGNPEGAGRFDPSQPRLSAPVSEPSVVEGETAAGDREQIAEMTAAVDGISSDYMTSEDHHPGWVLIPETKFRQLCEVEKALSQPRPEGEMREGWRPIETAPKDGTRILLICATAYSPVAAEGWWGWCSPDVEGWLHYSLPEGKWAGGVTRWFPTHWQPMPSYFASLSPVDGGSVGGTSCPPSPTVGPGPSPDQGAVE